MEASDRNEVCEFLVRTCRFNAALGGGLLDFLLGVTGPWLIDGRPEAEVICGVEDRPSEALEPIKVCVSEPSEDPSGASVEAAGDLAFL
jgi:hypothetical protein